MRISFTLFLLSITLSLSAQTFTGAGGLIPDDGTTGIYPIAVSGLPSSLDTINFGLERVCLNLTHTWNGDLAVFLRAPDGTLTQLFAGVGGDTDGFDHTCLDGNATTSIYAAGYPFTGTYRPQGDMGFQNNGQNPNGEWDLVILDTYPFADSGELFDWSITFGSNPNKPYIFESSDLPIVKIHTGSPFIPDEPKIDGIISVIDNGPGQRNFTNQTNYAYQGPIGIETHGNSSQGFPKKSYKMETRDSLGGDLNVSLLDLPETSDFVLLANFSDKTMVRNALTYQIARETGEYAPRTRFCEVFVNDIYQGVYNLTERIKRGKDRIDVSKLSPADTTGVALTGGYIVTIDWGSNGWYSQFPQPNSPQKYTFFQHEYPRPDEIQPVQSAYIQHFVDSFEVALASPNFQDTALGWRNFANEKSFIDYMLLNEISKNVDGYRLSTYFYKDRDDKDGKIHMGPAWDFDLAWLNADYCDAFLPTGWGFNLNYVCQDAGIPFWWEKLASDTLFVQNVACRWQSLRQTTLSKEHLFFVVDSMAARVEEAQHRNFHIWPILGIYVWPNPSPIPDTYAGEVTKLKAWISQRIGWLDFSLAHMETPLDPSFTATYTGGYNWQFQSGQNNHLVTYHWDFGDGSTSEAQNPSHTYTVTGTYEVKLTVSTPFGCDATSMQIIHQVNTAVVDVERNPVRVTPNPAHESLNLQWSTQTKENASILLLNSLGQVVLRSELMVGENSLILPVEELPRGAYSLLVLQGDRSFRSSVLLQ